MDQYDLVIKNIKTLSADVNIFVKHGKITKISSHLPNYNAKKTIEGSGLVALSGIIDSQVHFREPGLTHKEDLESGTKGAILGGVTSVFEMPNTIPATTTQIAFDDKMKRAKGRAWCNYAFYFGGSPDNVSELPYLEKSPSCPGVKVFMGSSTGTLLVEDDATLEKILQNTKKRIIVHCEDEYRLRERKHIAIDSKDVRNHHVWRDAQTAFMATQRLLKIAKKYNHPVHVLHVTTAEEMELLKGYKDIATVEVLPQHLTLFAPDCYERLKAFAQQNPPIREKKHQDALWKAIHAGVVDVIGSDHAPHTIEEKSQEYPLTPSGMPGVQTMLPIMLHHHSQGRITLEKIQQMMSFNPAKIFNLKNKGQLAEGFDADITIVDLKKTFEIKNSDMATKSGWTPYNGMKITGRPIITIIGGNIVMREGEVLGTPMGSPCQFQM